MGSKINLKARIRRHSRVLKDSIARWKRASKNTHYSYSMVMFMAIFLVPVYPTFASLVYDNEVGWEIDESSIISTYSQWGDIVWEWNLIAEAKESFLSVNTSLEDERDVSATNEVISYVVKWGDNISKIANKFRVSAESIYWANDITSKKVLHPWDVIKIPPVSGVIHEVKSGDSLSLLASKYKVSEEDIMRQNLLSAVWDLKIWDTLIIPWAKKIEPPKVIVPKKQVVASVTTSKSTAVVSANTVVPWNKTYAVDNSSKNLDKKATAKLDPVEEADLNSKWVYQLRRRAPQHTFYRWNCTRYVGQYKNVNWWWNAKDWLVNAQKMWHPTWSAPTVWSIVVFHGAGYSPRYGHVAIVMKIEWDYIYISDMNYRKLWEVTYRKVSRYHKAIKWYIYVD